MGSIIEVPAPLVRVDEKGCVWWRDVPRRPVERGSR
jgi:hypothetical protein